MSGWMRIDAFFLDSFVFIAGKLYHPPKIPNQDTVEMLQSSGYFVLNNVKCLVCEMCDTSSHIYTLILG